jgi:HAMP domain-containing protein
MTPVYVLLLIALLALCLYATWRPSSKKKLRQLQRTRMRMNPASVQATTRTDLTPLDYPVNDAPMSAWSAPHRSERSA